ncbi:CAP domain-containing protein [Motilibacter deserti]|uniref:CAP domain-containing protein n=1 Tax=Motilibacter deserti TaxID=2714956 RepID=A0ABX0GTV5_9ACTN|nr:CAP domain-containing protein [Motilibacter deserti]
MTQTASAAPVKRSNAALAKEVLADLNASRRAHGLAPLKARTDLNAYAAKHSKAMAGPGKLYHSSGLSTLCCWARVGENVAYAGSAAQASETLYASAPHRANILDRRFDEVGVAVVQSGGLVWVTEVFRDRRG